MSLSEVQPEPVDGKLWQDNATGLWYRFVSGHWLIDTEANDVAAKTRSEDDELWLRLML